MNDQFEPYQRLIAQRWSDPLFKQRLLADPLGTLQQEGVAIPVDLEDAMLAGVSGGGEEEYGTPCDFCGKSGCTVPWASCSLNPGRISS